MRRILWDGSMGLCPDPEKPGALRVNIALKWHEMVASGPDHVAWAIEYVQQYEREDASVRKWCQENGEPWESTPYVYTVAPDGVSLVSTRYDSADGSTRHDYIRFGEGWTDEQRRNVLNAFRRDGKEGS